MASAFDVAKYILETKGDMPHMKLQKLVYYSQAWSLVWDDAPLFVNRIEAWANGPVIRDLYRELRQTFTIDVTDLKIGDPLNLTLAQVETVDAVIEGYGDRSSQWLSDLTHMEKPWRLARRGLNPGEHGRSEISHASMAGYYSNL
jgi:uncharacterized phage-associated protein